MCLYPGRMNSFTGAMMMKIIILFPINWFDVVLLLTLFVDVRFSVGEWQLMGLKIQGSGLQKGLGPWYKGDHCSLWQGGKPQEPRSNHIITMMCEMEGRGSRLVWGRTNYTYKALIPRAGRNSYGLVPQSGHWNEGGLSEYLPPAQLQLQLNVQV